MASNRVSDGAMFLYQCLLHSNAKVDFNAVGVALSIKAGAANMRMTRLKKRIEAQGAYNSRNWNVTSLDSAATFLFTCIESSNCKINFSFRVFLNKDPPTSGSTYASTNANSDPQTKVGSALTPSLNTGAASMRYKRLQLKHAPAADAPAATTPVATTTATSSIPVTRPTTALANRKRKLDAQDDASKKVKREEFEEHDESEDGKRKTRGKEVDFKKMLDDSDDDAPPAPSFDGASDDYEEKSEPASSDDDYSENDWSNKDSDEDDDKPSKKKPDRRQKSTQSTTASPTRSPSADIKSVPATPVKTRQNINTVGLATPPSTGRIGTRSTRSFIPRTPVGLSGTHLQLSSSHAASTQPFPSIVPPLIKVPATIIITEAEMDEMSDMEGNGNDNETLVAGADKQAKEDIHTSARQSAVAKYQALSALTGDAQPASDDVFQLHQEFQSAVQQTKMAIEATQQGHTGSAEAQVERILEREVSKSATPEIWEDASESFDEAIPTIESDSASAGRGLFARVASWF